MSKNNFVSVVIPTYNSKKFITKTFLSIINQTYKEFEIIFVDDCSNDGTYGLLQKLKNKYKNKVKLIKTKTNSGTVAAPRNLGIKYCKGSIICFVDSDDIWEKNKLEYQLKEYNNKTILCTAARYFNHRNEKSGLIINFFRKILQSFIINKVNKKGFHWFYLYNPIVVSSVMINKEIIKKNLFDAHVNAREDLDLWIRLRKKKYTFKFQNYTMVNICRRPDSMSSDFKKELITLIRSKSNIIFKLNNFSNLNFFLIGTIMKFFLTFVKINQNTINNFFKKIFIFIAITIFVIFYSPIFWHLGKPLLVYDTDKELKNVKNFVLFSGHGNTSYYNMTYQYRYLDIKNLLDKTKDFENVFILGRLQQIPEQKLIEKLLISDGYQKDRIKVIYQEYNNTYLNIKNISKVLEEQNIDEIIFITSPYHTKRSKLLWEANSKIKVNLYKSYEWPSKNKFFEYAKNKKIILYEYLSILYNKILNKI